MENFLTEDNIEKLFVAVQPISVDFFLAGLWKSYDYSWIEKMFEKAIDGEFAVEESGGTHDTYLGAILGKLPESMFDTLFRFLEKFAPNAISYNALCYILRMKVPEEDFLVNNYHHFLAQGLTQKLANIAIENDYADLVMLLGLAGG